GAGGRAARLGAGSLTLGLGRRPDVVPSEVCGAAGALSALGSFTLDPALRPAAGALLAAGSSRLSRGDVAFVSRDGTGEGSPPAAGSVARGVAEGTRDDEARGVSDEARGVSEAVRDASDAVRDVSDERRAARLCLKACLSEFPSGDSAISAATRATAIASTAMIHGSRDREGCFSCLKRWLKPRIALSRSVSSSRLLL